MRVNWETFKGAAAGIGVAMALSASAALADDFTVTSNADDGVGTLREAITAANASDSNPDTITIDLPAESAIALFSPLPPIAAQGPVTVVSNLDITIDASGIGENENAITVSSPGVSISGLRINGAPGSGILIVAANATVTASLLDGNGTGITIEVGVNATIGGIESSARNIIINSARAGISISGNAPGFSILGNYLGIDLDGNAAGNGSVGISISGATLGQVGNLSGNGGNVISGNDQGGISISGSSGLSIRGNTIGLDPAQNIEVPNGGPGISISGGSNLTIGEPGNVIAGNGGGGIFLLNTTGVTITSNRVGLNASDTPFFNGGPGVSLNNSTQNTIGSSTAPNKGNLIAANSGPGVLLDAGSNDNQIKNNNIGLNTVFQGIGNVGDGIRIIASNGNQIGGPEANAGNIICSSVESGVEINGGVNNTLEANWVGVDPLDVSHPNSSGGVTIFGGATGNKIGNAAGAGNIIRRNSGFGVLVNGPTTTNNTIRFNNISNNTSGGISLLNGANGAVTAPVITGIGSAFGTAPALALVDLYVDESTQGATYLGTVSANGAGNFSSNVDLTLYVDQFLTAIATTASGSSTFSAPFSIVIPEGAVDGEGDLDGEGGTEGEGEGGPEGIVEGEGEPLVENDQCPVDTEFSQPIDLTVSSFAPNSSGGPVSYENFSGISTPIAGLRWWGTAIGIFGECTSETPEFLVTFYLDDAGFPGEPITTRIVAPTLSPTGRLIASGAEQAHDAIFDVPVSLSEGWVSIENLEITGCTSNWVAASADGGTSLTVDESVPTVVTNEFDLSLCLIGGEALEGEGEELSPLLSCAEDSVVGQAVGEQVVQGGQSNSNNAFRSFEKFSGLTGEYHGLRWWGTYSSPLGGDCFAAGASFNVTLYADEENRPGALIFSELVTPSAEATGRSAFGVEERVFDVNLVNPIAVDSGWLLIEDLNTTGCIYRWTSSPGGDGFSLTQVTTTEAYAENNFDLAYCLTPGLAPEGAQDGEGTGEGFAEGEGEGSVLEPHTADINGDGIFSLTELLRVVQLFNADAYRCFAGEGESEDGFEPGAGDCLVCGGHDADYDVEGADCVVELSELLRQIQLFSLGSYGNCLESEDGFCGLG
ncbi:MAG: hypothetical protein RLZZ303_2998 [Candidatus Hydrogenedentota bacterium]|jgi:hypothetical protein